MLKFLVGKTASEEVNDAKTSLVQEPPQKVVVFRKDLVISCYGNFLTQLYLMGLTYGSAFRPF
jgi:hypothetical protein